MTKREKYKEILNNLEHKLKNHWDDLYICNELNNSKYPDLAQDWHDSFAPKMQNRYYRTAWLNTVPEYLNVKKANALRLQMLRAKAYGKIGNIQRIKKGIQERYNTWVRNNPF